MVPRTAVSQKESWTTTETGFGIKGDRTMKKYFALFLMAAALVACTGIEQPELIEEPDAPKTYTMTVNASKAVDTKALSLVGKTLKATWDEGEIVEVYQSGTKIGVLTAAASTDASTTLSGSFENAPSTSDDLSFYFPTADNPSYSGQDGTLEKIATTYDFCAPATVTAGNFSVNSTTKEISVPGGISFGANQQAVIKFTLKKKADNSNLVIPAGTALIVNDGTNDYTVIPSSATNVLFVAIPATSNVNLRTLIDGDGYGYYKKGVALTAGQYYEITVKMTHQYVDLGLTSGMKWAISNISESGFVSSPEEFGDYYAWGETEPYYSSLDPLTWKDGKDEGYR